MNAARVKRFGYNLSVPKYLLGVESYLSLSCAAQGMKLLPRVQEIAWIQDDDVYPFITLLLSHTVRNLSLCLEYGLNVNQLQVRMRLSLLPLIVTLSPHLTQLTLRYFGCNRSDFAEAFGTPQLWSSLQCLQLYACPEISLAMLCKFSNLRELWLHCRSSPFEIIPLPQFCSGFPQLQILKIWGFSKSVITLTKIMHNASLQSFVLRFPAVPVPHADHLTHLFNGMREGQMAHSSLRTVRLHHDASRKKTESTASLRPLTLKDMSGLLVSPS